MLSTEKLRRNSRFAADVEEGSVGNLNPEVGNSFKAFEGAQYLTSLARFIFEWVTLQSLPLKHETSVKSG